MTLSDAAFVRRILIVLAVIVAAVLAWRLRDVELLLFGSILTAVLLTRLTRTVARFTRLPQGLALGVTVALSVLALIVAGAFFGWRMQAQAAEAVDLLPKGFQAFMAELKAHPFGRRLLQEAQQLRLETAVPELKRLPFYALSAIESVAALIAVLVGGVYLAAQPGLYRKGLLRLVPQRARGSTDEVLDVAGGALIKWLLGQLVAMGSVGTLVGLGLWIIGVPASAALGLFAGLAEFVPVVGPIVSAVPALLLALLHGVHKAAWTLLLFILVQQFENHLLLPLVQRHFGSLPPVVTLFSILAFAVVLGPLGVLLSVPLTVVATAAIGWWSDRRRAAGQPAAGD